ncbi:unnamed protein product [Gadus morhua 'NCC']
MYRTLYISKMADPTCCYKTGAPPAGTESSAPGASGTSCTSFPEELRPMPVSKFPKPVSRGPRPVHKAQNRSLKAPDLSPEHQA